MLEIADFHIRRNDAGPFGARAQEPATAPQQARGMERVPRNEQLHVLAAAQVRPDDDALRPAVGVRQEAAAVVRQFLAPLNAAA